MIGQVVSFIQEARLDKASRLRKSIVGYQYLNESSCSLFMLRITKVMLHAFAGYKTPVKAELLLTGQVLATLPVRLIRS